MPGSNVTKQKLRMADVEITTQVGLKLVTPMAGISSSSRDSPRDSISNTRSSSNLQAAHQVTRDTRHALGLTGVKALARPLISS